MICQFISYKKNKYYLSGKFEKLLNKIIKDSSRYEVKEKKSKNGETLIVVINDISSIDEAVKNLKIF